MEKSIYVDKHIYIIEEKEGMNLREHGSIEKWLEWEKWRKKLCNYILLSKIMKIILKKITFGLLHSLFLYKLWIKNYGKFDSGYSKCSNKADNI